jgi:hypothetical protein
MGIRNKVLTITLVWTIQDIKNVKPALTDDQCLEVLKMIDKLNGHYLPHWAVDEQFGFIRDAISELNY